MLYVDRANALTVKDPENKVHHLDRVLPETTKEQGGRGLTMSVEANCNTVAQAITGVGNLGSSQILKKGLGDLASFGEFRVAKYLQQRGQNKTHEEAKGTLGGNLDAKKVDEIAKAYATFLRTQPVQARLFARELGVNQYVAPEVGQAFGSVSLGFAKTGEGMPDYVTDPTGATKKAPSRGEIWGTHYGAVVARSGGDTMTLENYARNFESGGKSRTNEMYYFQMYGPVTKPEQTWHKIWSETTRPIINPITQLVGKKPQDGFQQQLDAIPAPVEGVEDPTNYGTMLNQFKDRIPRTASVDGAMVVYKNALQRLVWNRAFVHRSTAKQIAEKNGVQEPAGLPLITPRSFSDTIPRLENVIQQWIDVADTKLTKTFKIRFLRRKRFQTTKTKLTHLKDKLGEFKDYYDKRIPT